MGVHGILESLNWLREDLWGYPEEDDNEWWGYPEDFPEDRAEWTPEQQEVYRVGAVAHRAAREAEREENQREYKLLNAEYPIEEDLFYAIEKGDTVTLEYLLEQGTDPHMLSSLQRTGALAQACEAPLLFVGCRRHC